MEVNTSSITDPTNMYNYMNQFVADPTILIVACLVILVFAVFFSSLGNDASSSISTDMLSSSSGNSIGYIIAFVLVMLIGFHAFQYFFSINVRAFFTNLFTLKPELDVVIDQTKFEPSVVPEIKLKKQVYNIPGNYYDYTNAKALCNAYGSRLASYKEVETAYKNGGEWCNYGWSEGQMAYFPTQKDTWNKLQENKQTKNACGRPGINGGFIGNPNVRFGANCYGVKPPQPTGWNPGLSIPASPATTHRPVNPRIQKMKDTALLNAFSQPKGEWSEYFGIQKAKK